MNSEQELEKQKRKIIIISEIDELKVITNNHYLMGKYDEAIKTAEEIIELAKKAELNSIVREQQKFISKIYKLIEKGDQKSFLREDFEDLQLKFNNLLNNDKVNEAHEIVDFFKKKYEKIIDLSSNSNIKKLIEGESQIWEKHSKKQSYLKKQLEPLEIQLNSYLSTNNVTLANEALRKAKNLLEELKDVSIKEKWETLEAIFIELKKKYDFREKIEESIQEVAKLTDKYEFIQAKNLLKSIYQVVEEKNLEIYKKDLKVKEKSILDAEQKYNKLVKDIENLEGLVEKNIKNFLFNEAIENCNQIVKISRFIGKENYVNKYSEYIEDIKNKIKDFNEFENLRMSIITLNSEALSAVNKEDFELALNKFKEIKEKLETFKPEK
ncbi:MAG: hypothetical protein ACFE8E_13690 [Candidatus Hodarchaeota archaeon]